MTAATPSSGGGGALQQPLPEPGPDQPSPGQVRGLADPERDAEGGGDLRLPPGERRDRHARGLGRRHEGDATQRERQVEAVPGGAGG